MPFSWGGFAQGLGESVPRALQGIQQHQDDEERKQQADRDYKARMAQQIFTNGLMADTAGREKVRANQETAQFGMNARAAGYTYQDPTQSAGMAAMAPAAQAAQQGGLDGPGAMASQATSPVMEYLATVGKQAQQNGGWAKTGLTDAQIERQQQQQLQRTRAQQLAQSLGIPYSDGIDLATLEKLYVDKHNQPKTTYDSARGAIVNTETGEVTVPKGLPAKPVNEFALAGREAAQATREENTKNRFVGAMAARYQNNPIIKRANVRADVLNQVTSLLDLNNPIADIGLQTEVAKLFDPMRVVSDAKTGKLSAAQGASDRVKLLIETFNSGKQLSDKQKNDIREIARNEIKNGARQVAPLQRNLGAQLRERGYASDSSGTLGNPFEAVPLDVPSETPKTGPASKLFTKPAASTAADEFRRKAKAEGYTDAEIAAHLAKVPR